jgi:phenylalanyl-tRNA synthetase beta chain
MLCSAEELGMPKGEDGLLILGNEPAAGTPLGALFPSDTVLELEVTPNRPDLLSVNGIAREIGALTGKPVRFVGPQSAVSGVDAGAGAVQVASLERCPFYSARAIRGVKVVASPEWLRRKLEAVGLRPINNLVDVTNLVMLELGQPLHVFDADVLEGAVRVRCAVEGEEMVALDGKSYRLGAEELVIADGARPQAIAGIMGGEASGVTERTVNVLLESAYFEPRGIRRSARKLGLSSDSSYRFERGVDRAGVLRAAQRATELILELALHASMLCGPCRTMVLK